MEEVMIKLCLLSNFSNQNQNLSQFFEYFFHHLKFKVILYHFQQLFSFLLIIIYLQQLLKMSMRFYYYIKNIYFNAFTKTYKQNRQRETDNK